MNVIFYIIVAVSVLYAGLAGIDLDAGVWDHTLMKAVGDAALDKAKGSVDLAIGLVGYIALFLGLMEVVKEAGGLDFMARLIRPVMVRLFPSVPADHPAMGAMIMNIAANALGLGNAATPFGLKAMQELQSLNVDKKTASNAMCLFLAINTSGLALIPSGIIGLRAKMGSLDAAAIFPTTLFATAVSTVVGITAAKLLARSPWFRQEEPQQPRERMNLIELLPFVLAMSAMIGLVVGVYAFGQAASALIIPGLVFGMLTVGAVRRVKVYEVFVRGAKEGFSLALMIIPYLVAILVAVGMLRASGALDGLVSLLSPLLAPIGMPGEVLPLALMRPLSGSGAFGLTAELLQTHGADSFIGYLASTMNGSTETTFYVLAVYFGSVGVTKTRHAVFAGLAADITGALVSVLAVSLLLT